MLLHGEIMCLFSAGLWAVTNGAAIELCGSALTVSIDHEENVPNKYQGSLIHTKHAQRQIFLGHVEPLRQLPGSERAFVHRLRPGIWISDPAGIGRAEAVEDVCRNSYGLSLCEHERRCARAPCFGLVRVSIARGRDRRHEGSHSADRNEHGHELYRASRVLPVASQSVVCTHGHRIHDTDRKPSELDGNQVRLHYAKYDGLV
mmetsp:Transcript_28319/g.61541  ORF Transcript_28319/g.61541 Transcript_28319/m.61541 type:complete len:203 (-) Transcript_28319:1307-1915(-)